MTNPNKLDDFASSEVLPHRPSPIHSDPLNFAQYFSEEHEYAIISNVYAGEEVEIDTNKPTIHLLLGLSGAGKDFCMDVLTEKGFPVHHVVTATSRHRRYEHHKDERLTTEQKAEIDKAVKATESREDRNAILDMLHTAGYIIAEPSDKYTWMRLKQDDETEEAYHVALIQEYDLIENDRHNLTIYGLPRANFESALAMGKIPVIRTEVNGAITLTTALREQGYNTVTYVVLPDSFEQAEEVIREREEKPEVAKKRIMENKDHMAKFPLVANFYIRNTRQAKTVTYGEKVVTYDGKHQTYYAFKDLFNHLGIFTH
jgi:guanylate kinase